MIFCFASTDSRRVDQDETIAGLRDEMVAAARKLLFEKAALIREQIRELERLKSDGKPVEEPEKYKTQNAIRNSSSNGVLNKKAPTCARAFC